MREVVSAVAASQLYVIGSGSNALCDEVGSQPAHSLPSPSLPAPRATHHNIVVSEPVGLVADKHDGAGRQAGALVEAQPGVLHAMVQRHPSRSSLRSKLRALSCDAATRCAGRRGERAIWRAVGTAMKRVERLLFVCVQLSPLWYTN